MGMHWKRWERSPQGSDWGWKGRFWPRLAGRMSDFIQHRNPTHTPVPGALRPSRNQIPFGHLPGHQLLSPGSIILVPRVPASPQPTHAHTHREPHTGQIQEQRHPGLQKSLKESCTGGAVTSLSTAMSPRAPGEVPARCRGGMGCSRKRKDAFTGANIAQSLLLWGRRGICKQPGGAGINHGAGRGTAVT